MKLLSLLIIVYPFYSYADLKTEVRAGLSKAGFNYFLQQTNFSKETRNDYYIEAYNGQDYILKNVTLARKFRLKSFPGKTKAQLSKRLLDRTVYQCGSTMLQFSQKDSIQIKLKNELSKKLEKTFLRFEGQIQNAHSHLPKTKKEFNKLIGRIKKKIPSELEHIPGIKQTIFLPSHHTVKNIYNRNYSLNGKIVEISLREVIDFDHNGYEHFSYELEAQPKDDNKWSKRELLETICLELKLADLPGEYFSQERFDASSENLIFIRKVNDLLGF